MKVGTYMNNSYKIKWKYRYSGMYIGMILGIIIENQMKSEYIITIIGTVLGYILGNLGEYVLYLKMKKSVPVVHLIIKKIIFSNNSLNEHDCQFFLFIHFQFRISSRSIPFSRIYCLCSTSLSYIHCDK